MIIKSHLCGIAVAFDRFEGEQYEDNGDPRGQFFNSTQGRPQGSRYSQQKRKIADACEFMRKNSKHKPRIFVATCPGYISGANEIQVIKKLTHNLRNGYGCKKYVWVREFTKMGYPHFHFIADIPEFDATKLSLYWSALFNSSAPNSIRLGTAPRCNKCRTKLDKKGDQCFRSGCGGVAKVEYFLKDKRMTWYMGKYIAKGVGKHENPHVRVGVQPDYETYFEYEIPIRRFAVSQELAKLSAPQEFKSKMIRQETGRHALTVNGLVPFMEDVRIWQNCKDTMTDKEAMSRWNWKETGFANTYLGYPKDWKLK